MDKKLILVDFESVQRIDLSMLDDSYRALVFVGSRQDRPKAARRPETAHRFKRVDFQQVDGPGRNALDFYIAFQLGRMFETDRSAQYYVLSRDKGFDPLLVHLNRNGLKCKRIETIAELVPVSPTPTGTPECPHCCGTDTIELHGGRWCSNCARFAVAADPALLPSNQAAYRDPDVQGRHRRQGCGLVSTLVCDSCHRPMDTGDGIYDDGEWMCWACVDDY